MAMITNIRLLPFILWLCATFRRTTFEVKCFTDYSIESLKLLNETSVAPFCNQTIQLKRTRTTDPKVFWEGDLVDDIDKYEMEFRISYSSAGNDLYRLLPYRIYRQPICDVLNNVYRHSLMEDAKQYSNAPYSKDKNVDLCNLMPKGHYYFRNYSISPSIFPTKMKEGRYREELYLYEKNKDEIVSGIFSTQLVT
ncbi:uncharacterized protein LOC119072306 isoform X1 [Bradysia coprophila]|uniref:uncharacterized protein LOC119072306 isoform X1 n=1 Tax=Bradysia coprophila TaxID=38358 RepID=UPI00187DD695|nr:uncharacterized protein LOC119072306 isoform X1 [Bradysia coprophila]